MTAQPVPSLSLASMVQVASAQVSRQIEGEAVILHLDRAIYFGLSGVGARIWELLQQPHTVGSIRDVLTHEYAVESAECEADLLAVLGELRQAGLIEVR